MEGEELVEKAYNNILKQPHPDTLQAIKEHQNSLQSELYNRHKNFFIKRHGANEDGSAKVDGYTSMEDEGKKKHFSKQALHELLLHTLETELGDKKSAEAMFDKEKVTLHDGVEGFDYHIKKGAKKFVDSWLKEHFKTSYDQMLSQFEATPSILAAYHDEKSPINKFMQNYAKYSSPVLRDLNESFESLAKDPKSQALAFEWVNKNLLQPNGIQLKANHADLQFMTQVVEQIGDARIRGIPDDKLAEEFLKDKVHFEAFSAR